MSKALAGFYGQKSIQLTDHPKPKEYTVLGINQPLICPDESPMLLSEAHPLISGTKDRGQRSFLVSLLPGKWI